MSKCCVGLLSVHVFLHLLHFLTILVTTRSLTIWFLTLSLFLKQGLCFKKSSFVLVEYFFIFLFLYCMKCMLILWSNPVYAQLSVNILWFPCSSSFVDLVIQSSICTIVCHNSLWLLCLASFVNHVIQSSICTVVCLNSLWLQCLTSFVDLVIQSSICTVVCLNSLWLQCLASFDDLVIQSSIFYGLWLPWVAFCWSCDPIQYLHSCLPQSLISMFIFMYIYIHLVVVHHFFFVFSSIFFSFHYFFHCSFSCLLVTVRNCLIIFCILVVPIIALHIIR